MELKKIEEELPLHRLACGCLVRCHSEGGGEWVEHKKCKTIEGNCKIDEYVKNHKTCLVCGRCLTCFDHSECKRLTNVVAKSISWIASYIIFPIYGLIDYIKYKFNR